MSGNDRTIWVAQLGQGDESFLLRQTAYLNHLGSVYAQGWRAQAYSEDCERRGERPTTIPAVYRDLHLYHVRRSRTLNESVALQDQDLREGDVFVLTKLPDEVVIALVKNHGVPDVVDPKKHPYGNRLSMADLSARASGTPPINSPWITGSFYLIAVCVVMAFLGVLSNKVPALALPLVLIAGPLIVIVVGILQLRNDERLKDSTFKELLLAVIKSLPLLRGRGKARHEEDDAT
jgi:hypothetical protein